VVAGAERTPWLEVYKAINECLPRARTVEEQEEDNPTLQNRIRLLSITTKKYDNLDEWYKGLDPDKQKRWLTEEDKKKGPTGPGYVFTLQGRHFHDEKNVMMSGIPYVENTLLRNLHQWSIPEFDVSKLANTGVIVPVRQLGISHATIADSQPISTVKYYKNGPGAAAAGGSGTGMVMPGMNMRGGKAGRAQGSVKTKTGAKSVRPSDEPPSEDFQPIPMYDFTIEFAWHEIPPEKRVPNDPGLPLAAAPGTPPTAAPLTAAPVTAAPVASGLPSQPQHDARPPAHAATTP
jgi:type IV pilus assembly protein PilM